MRALRSPLSPAHNTERSLKWLQDCWVFTPTVCPTQESSCYVWDGHVLKCNNYDYNSDWPFSQTAERREKRELSLEIHRKKILSLKDWHTKTSRFAYVSLSYFQDISSKNSPKQREGRQTHGIERRMIKAFLIFTTMPVFLSSLAAKESFLKPF